MSRGKSISAWKVLLLGLPALLLLLALGSGWWLLRSASGASWVWSQIETAAAGTLKTSRVDGNLASGFVIHGLDFRSENLDLLVHQVRIEVRPGWWPLSVEVASLLARDVEIVSRSVQGKTEAASAELEIQTILENLKPRFPVRVHSGELTNITLQQDDEAVRKLLASVRFKAGLGEMLLVEQLDLLTSGLQTTINGSVKLEPPYALSVNALGRFENETGVDGAGLAFPFKLESSGKLEAIQFVLASTGSGVELQSKSFDFSMAGSTSATGLQLNSVSLDGLDVDVEAKGTIDWSSQLQSDLDVTIHTLDPSPWVSAWPDDQKLSGGFDLNWSKSGVQIPTGHISVAGTELAVVFDADVDVAANTVDIHTSWDNFAWPLASAAPVLTSPSGELRASGTLDDWRIAGQLLIETGDYPQGSFEIEGGGNRTSASLAIPGGQVLGGSVTGKAGADWETGLAWDLAVEATDIDPEPIFPGWTGRLDVELVAETTDRAGETRIEFASLQGTMRGVRIDGHGGIAIVGDRLTFNDLELHTDNAVLKLDGSTSDTAGATFAFNGSIPSTLLQGASGMVEMEGRYSEVAGDSLLEVQLDALDLAWNGFFINALAVSTQDAGAPGPVQRIQLDASGLAWQDLSLDEISLSLSPVGERYALALNLAAPEFAVKSAMLVTPENPLEPFNTHWQGQVDNLSLALAQTYRFELLEQSPLSFSRDSATLGPVCLREDAGAELCLGASHEADGARSLVADVTTFPMDYLGHILGLDVHFEQNLEGRLEWLQLAGQAPTGGADFRLSGGRVLDPEDNDVLTQTDEGRFGFELKNGNLESGVLDIKFPGNGFIDIDFSVQDIADAGDRKLLGRAVTRLDDIDLVGQLAFPFMDDFNGQLESNIRFGGSLENPAFDGGFRLSNGLVRYAPVGLKLENVDLEGVLDKDYRGALKGKFQAGDGLGSIDGHFDFKDLENIRVDVALAGDQLLLVNTEDLKISAETDLRLDFSPRGLGVDGYVRVPSARLTPANLLLERVSDSEDLVIESNRPVVETGIQTKTPAYRINGQLEVTLGDDVFVKVPDIEAHISGSVIYNWQGTPMPMAEGNYRINGSVDVYGPTLLIENGSVSFPGVPANNPLLNIRAEREIFGNTQIRSAGVQVIGTLKRHKLEAYTVPVTNEDRAWTLLVTGSDFDQGQGVGGFDVGTYIIPKLYVSYGISLFEDENVFSARYDLKKGFGVKVTSGQRETGADISYTVDK